MASVRSTPTTCAPVRAASCRATPAGPVATSSTRRGPARDDVVHHGPAPAAVLSEREPLGQAVVALGKAGEQAAGEAAVAGAGGERLVGARCDNPTERPPMSEVFVVAEHFDVAVVGSGPAGSVAALVLARAGARVALVDKATFPRDKACGDAVGPRGVALLDDLGLTPDANGARLGDMVVVGPSGRRLRLPCFEGVSYPGHGVALPRQGFDAWLAERALDAGARAVTGRVEHIGAPRTTASTVRRGVGLDDGRTARRPTWSSVPTGPRAGWPTRPDWSTLGGCCGGSRSGCTSTSPWRSPTSCCGSPSPGALFPGYGWLFPGPDGRANAGLGIGTMSDRRAGAGAVRLLPAFLEHLRRMGLVERPRGRIGAGTARGLAEDGHGGHHPRRRAACCSPATPPGS